MRVHNLGDFYSVEHVELWRTLLERHPALRVWGYTARWHSDDPIAVALSSPAKMRALSDQARQRILEFSSDRDGLTPITPSSHGRSAK
jgi:hypothetical protein